MKILISTSNKYKVNLIKKVLVDYDVQVVTPKELGLKLDVEESGESVVENAVLKAMALCSKVKMPVLGWDKAMYVDNFPENEQPGLYVRRVNGVDLTDKQMIEYYANKVKDYGGESLAHYTSGVAIVTDEDIFSTSFNENDFVLTSQINYDSEPKYGAMHQILRSPETGKYYCDMTDEEISKTDTLLEKNMKEFIVKTIKPSKMYKNEKI